jgi:thymidylate kinase
MIILEGADLSGKSTLSKALRSHIPLLTKQANYGIPDGDPTDDYVKELKTCSHPKLYDRFLYGEVPYSIVKRPTKRYISTFELTLLELMVLSRPHLVVYCRPQREEHFRRFADKGDEYITDATQLHRLIEEYDAMFEHTIAKVRIHDEYNTDSIITMAKRVALDSHWEDFRWWRRNCVEGIGTLQPQYLFIGDKYNPRAPHQVTWWSSSGRWLFDRLHSIRLPLNLCHFTNSVSNGHQVDMNYLKFMKPKRIICLGNNARDMLARHADALWDQGIQLSKIPHPQWWKRFKSDNVKEYEEGLRLSCGL